MKINLVEKANMGSFYELLKQVKDENIKQFKLRAYESRVYMLEI